MQIGLESVESFTLCPFCNKKKNEVRNTEYNFAFLYYFSWKCTKAKKGNNKETRLPFFGVVETMNR